VAVGGLATSFGPGQHGSTFGGNPLAAAVALTVLTVIANEGLLEQAKSTGADLEALLAAMPGVHGVRGKGLLLGALLDEPDASAIAAAGLDHGVIVNDCQPDVVRLAPPLVLGSAEVADAEQRLGAAWDQARHRAGQGPGA
jgi:acetylornithine aminotransferase